MFVLTATPMLYGCDEWLGLGPKQEEMTLVDSRALPDDIAWLFTFKHVVYQPPIGWRTFTARRKYLLDKRGIAIYDSRSGKIRVLHRSENDAPYTGSRSYHIQSVCWNHAIIGEVKNPPAAPNFYQIDLRTGNLKPLPFEEELNERKLERKWFDLVDDKGTIAVRALGAKSPTAPSKKRYLQIWLRRPSGQYQKIADYHNIEALGNGELRFQPPKASLHVIYDIAAGTYRNLSEQENRHIERTMLSGRTIPGEQASWCPGALGKTWVRVKKRIGNAGHPYEGSFEIRRFGKKELITVDLKGLLESSPVESVAEIDKKMQEEALQYVSSTAQGAKNCKVEWQTRDLMGPGTVSFEAKLLYADSLIASFLVQGWPEAWCTRVHDDVYVFLRLGKTRECLELCDPEYVSYSKDGGRTWSELISLLAISEAERVIRGRWGFRLHQKVLGDSKDHVMALNNYRERKLYLFSSEFRLLKTVPYFDRLGLRDSRDNMFWEVVFFKGTLYLATQGCTEKHADRDGRAVRMMDCRGAGIESSSDYGRTWQRVGIPEADELAFLEAEGALYYFYLERTPTAAPCSENPPARPGMGCGLLKVRKLNDDGTWTEPRTIAGTVVQFLGLLATERGPLLFWSDSRAYRPRVYAGFLDLERFRIEEGLIHHGRTLPVLREWKPKAPLWVETPVLESSSSRSR